jgi:hypothetical protein
MGELPPVSIDAPIGEHSVELLESQKGPHRKIKGATHPNG